MTRRWLRYATSDERAQLAASEHMLALLKRKVTAESRLAKRIKARVKVRAKRAG